LPPEVAAAASIAPARYLALVTRPIEDFPGTAAALAAIGWDALACPCQRIVLRPGLGAPGPAQALLLTSRNAVRALAGEVAWQALPAFCVGDATATAARAAGWRQVVSADGDARDLSRVVARQLAPQAGSLVLATANGAGAPLARLLRDAGFRVRRRVVYAMQPASALPGAAISALRQGLVHTVLFHAGGAARLFMAAIHAAGLAQSLRIVEACTISKMAAASLSRAPGDNAWRSIQWPARPTEAGMLALLARPAMAAAQVAAAGRAAAGPSPRPVAQRPARRRPR
jgi:uroporphyrinogen-III synthase